MTAPPLSKRNLLRLAPLAVIVLTWLIFFWRVLTPTVTDRLTFQQGDFTLQFLAYRQMAYRQLTSGQFPAFEECLYSGYPFQADPQSQVLYPPVLGLMLLGRALGWAEYPLRALEWEVMGHVLLAALGMYVFLRGQHLRALPAVFGALAFAFGGFMTGYAMLQTAILEAAAWLPLILWAVHGLAAPAPTPNPSPAYAGEGRELLPPPRSGGGSGWGLRWGLRAVLLAILVAVAYTAGHPQTLLFTIYAGAVAYVYWSVKYRLGWKAALARGTLAAAMALGLAAPQLIPSLSFMLASTRAALPFDKAGGGFALQDIALFALTGVINVWQPLYVGVATLVLAGAAIAAWRFTQPRHDTWLWLGIGLSALALGFGANALGFDLAYLLAPGYRQFQSQERHALVVAFALSTLGANRVTGVARAAAPARPAEGAPGGQPAVRVGRGGFCVAGGGAGNRAPVGTATGVGSDQRQPGHDRHRAARDGGLVRLARPVGPDAALGLGRSRAGAAGLRRDHGGSLHGGAEAGRAVSAAGAARADPGARRR